MPVHRLSFLVGGAVLALATAAPADAQTSPSQALRTCKNEAGQRMQSVPLAYISVVRGSDTGSGSYMINFRVEPPGGSSASGFCIISRYGFVQNVQFDPPRGNAGNGGGNNNGGNGRRIPAQAALQACKDTASARLPGVPRAFIDVSRGTDPGDGGYMINFRAHPRYAAFSSGFCNVTWNGRVLDFQFDAPPPPPPLVTPPSGDTINFGGRSPLEAMRSCKSVVSGRFPEVPLAYIEVDQPSVNGGSLLANFYVRAPNGLSASGSCDVFRNGRVNLSVR